MLPREGFGWALRRPRQGTRPRPPARAHVGEGGGLRAAAPLRAVTTVAPVPGRACGHYGPRPPQLPKTRTRGPGRADQAATTSPRRGVA